MKTKFTLAFIVCCIGFLNVVQAQFNKQDSLALVALYNSTNGANWKNHTNWLTSAPVTTWYGVYYANNRVTNLFLRGDNLTGTLPDALSNLTFVQILLFDDNNLSGSIPAALGKLNHMTDLSLASNKFSGSVPAELANDTLLTTLSLSFNSFSGNIPSSIGSIRSLTGLGLDYNNLPEPFLLHLVI